MSRLTQRSEAKRRTILVSAIGGTLLGLCLAPGCGGSGSTTVLPRLMYALTDQGRVLLVSAGSASTANQVFVVNDGNGNTVPVRGLDFDSGTNKLYAGHMSGNTLRWFEIDETTGNATPVTTGGLGNTGALCGVSYDPTANRFAVVIAPPGLNVRVGAQALTLDLSTSSVTGAQVSDLAHIGQESGATTTTAYAIDAAGDQLYSIGPAGGVQPVFSSGAATAVGGPIGLPPNPAPEAGFDIGGPNEVYAVFNFGGGSTLYSIDLVTGKGTRISPVGGLTAGEKVVGLALIE